MGSADKPEHKEASVEPIEVASNHNLVVTENITDLQNEVDSCKTPPIACRAPPSTPVVFETNTEKSAAAAFIGEKLSANVDFQQFSYSKELNVSNDIEEVKVVDEDEVLKQDIVEEKEVLKADNAKEEDLEIVADKEQDDH